jgi:drug/metabolite transporter (DMT)-like permease
LYLFCFNCIFVRLAYVLKYGYKVLGASEVVILASTSKFWNVLGASILLNEALTYRKIIGTLIILFGVAIVVYKKGIFKINKGVVLVLISAFLFALADILGYKVLGMIEASNFQIYFYFYRHCDSTIKPL